MKDAEAVYGNLGYNNVNISYNVESNTGNNSFGQFNPPAPVSSVCGAKNKTGGYCKRVVSGGGRCWQHK